MKTRFRWLQSFALLMLAFSLSSVIATLRLPMNAQQAGGEIKFQLPFSGRARNDTGAVIYVRNLGVAPKNTVGLQGEAEGTGVFGVSTGQKGAGVFGVSTGQASAGVLGSGVAMGVFGNSREGIGVKGSNGPAHTPNTLGSLGDKDAGVNGYAFSSPGEKEVVAGVKGYGKNIGVMGYTADGSGVIGVSGELTYIQTEGEEAIKGFAMKTQGELGSKGFGVKGSVTAPDDKAVYGSHKAGPFGFLGSKDVGVEGKSEVPGGKGVAGRGEGAGNSVGVYGESESGIAGFFRGRVTITESLLVNEINVGKLFGAAKLFRIDHPLEPATKYLSHASVESDEMTNLYSGNATLGSDGEAWVELPSWFEALNTDFRYQLTCVGGFASVYIAQEIKDNRFRIAGGKPGLKVSWQVTAVRQDAYAKAHPLHVEEEKAPGERGRYLNPVELGFAESRVKNRKE